MVRKDTLRRTLLALVPAISMMSVACSGASPDGAADQTTQDPAAAAAQGGDQSTSTSEYGDEQANAPAAAGSEADDTGYASALAQDGTTPPAYDGTPDDPGTDDGVATTSEALMTARGQKLSSEMQRMVSFLNKSTSYYDHTTYMNESTGTRRTDCSGFLGYGLNRVMPDAYAKVPHPNTFKPLADDWYDYLSTRYTSKTASPGSTPRWRRITKAANLQPGDVIAWIKPASVVSENTGHVMVVNSYARTGRSDRNEIIVDIIDSTEAPHANDSRGSSHTGPGTGRLGIKVDSNGYPVAYYWSGGVSTTAVYTKIAFGRVE